MKTKGLLGGHLQWDGIIQLRGDGRHDKDHAFLEENGLEERKPKLM